jgi:hypothetical protein
MFSTIRVFHKRFLCEKSCVKTPVLIALILNPPPAVAVTSVMEISADSFFQKNLANISVMPNLVLFATLIVYVVRLFVYT